MPERELRFTTADMERFAAGSGDRSPLHMDPGFARRTSFGRCIVFGGLETIAMLGALPPGALARVRSIRSLFPGPVLTDEPLRVTARSRPDRPDDWEVRLVGRGMLLARLIASAHADPSAIAGRAGPREIAWPGGEGTAEELAGCYSAGSELTELARRFGIERLDPGLLEGIAWASNVVGMSIPGFDGLCAAVTLKAPPEGTSHGTAASQRLRLLEYDERSDRLLIDGVISDQAGAACCLGLIECFPFSPTPLPDAAALTAAPSAGPVPGKVVVVGGSRGIGAALALALLGRGYEVHVVYAHSEGSVEHLMRLAGSHAARLSAHRLDAADPPAVLEAAEKLGGGIDGLALCAAVPPLPMGLTPDAVPALAEYVAQSVSLIAAPLAGFLPHLNRSGWVLFVSAAIVMDPPRTSPQLVTAKAAIEGLARWVARTTPSARVVVARPPVTRTDLVNTPSGRRAAAPAELVAEALAERLLTVDLPPGLEFIAPEIRETSPR